MNRGFYIILAAQFCSSLGDNVLLFAAIALLKTLNAAAWQTPVLQQSFVVAFILLAPFAGIFADALPKGRVMLISNSIKMLACALMLLEVHPLIAYCFAGIGAALYSPAKYGILAEYLPASQLVVANGWMEGLTVAAIILGAILGGYLISPALALLIQNSTAASNTQLAILMVLLIYGLAALFNLYIPKLPIERPLVSLNLRKMLGEFWRSLITLWRDPLGQVSLGVTSLFWGVGTTLRFIILIWAAEALDMELAQATQLTAVVAVGLAIGSIIAAKWVSLEHSVNVLSVGMLMGIVVAMMALVGDWRVAIFMLIVIGSLAGIFVIPMNALLQYRGFQLMGSGHSIAVQNFNENLSILLMLGGYALMIKLEFRVEWIVVLFGSFIFFAMAAFHKFHCHDQD